jgi:hypothetical protein
MSGSICALSFLFQKRGIRGTPGINAERKFVT